jgi:hypothetical protein
MWQEIETGTFSIGYKHLWCHQALSIPLGLRMALFIILRTLKGVTVAYPVPIPST